VEVFQKIVRDILVERHLLQYAFMESNGTAEEFQTK
jgi:hypothetical protein